MRAAAAYILHILSVHYLFVLFIAGLPALVTGLALRKRVWFNRFPVSWLFYLVFLTCLAGVFVFPVINAAFLEHYGLSGEALVVNSSQEPAWFRRTPELRLVLKIVPDSDAPFIEAVTVTPSIDAIERLGVGSKVRVLYSPDYTHNIEIVNL